VDGWAAVRTSGPWPEWAEDLVRAADQFIVSRWDAQGREGRSVIAGYHWFEDWGRDTMIGLPGLALVTGRSADAAPILRTFAEFISEGMLPNRFPDGSDTPEYNTIDATLWYFQAIRAYHETTGDDSLLRELWPKMQDIIDWHIKGTRYGIGVDPADSLLRGGQDGVQLTWMDAKVGDHVITPRIGKPVEVNALWYNALRAMARFAQRLGESGDEYSGRADAVARGFERFWSDSLGHCYDVLDGPGGDEAKLRPNQLLVLSLPEPLLGEDQRRKVLEACGEVLLTSRGLRTLPPDDPDYRGHYGGDQTSRDGAYHQGTVWAWLLGPYVSAHLKVHRDPQAALHLLESLGDHLAAAGLGSISEIFDGDAPYTPRGCIAQAWSVAEVLRATNEIIQALAAPQPNGEGKA